MDRMAWLRLLGVLVVPYVRFGRAIWLARRKGYGRELRTAWPAIPWLYLVQGAGQVKLQ